MVVRLPAPTAAQITSAGLDLVAQSRLVRWLPDEPELAPAVKTKFDAWVPSQGEFGRLRSWIPFSVGCEYLVKAACLANLVVKIDWDDQGNPRLGELGRYCTGNAPQLRKLMEKVHRPTESQALVTQCDLLRARVRNRDLHLLVKNVRDQDFQQLETHYVPMLNTVLSTFPAGSDAELAMRRAWETADKE